MQDLSDEILLSLVENLSYDDRENLRNTSRRFAKFLIKKCIDVPAHLIKIFYSVRGELKGFLCGHIDRDQFVGPVKISITELNNDKFLVDEFTLEGKVKMTKEETSDTREIARVQSMLRNREMIPVGKWIVKQPVEDISYYSFFNFDDQGERHGVWNLMRDHPDHEEFLLIDHGTLIIKKTIDEDGVKQVTEYVDNVEKFEDIIFSDRLIRYEKDQDGQVLSVYGCVSDASSTNQYIISDGIKYGLIFYANGSINSSIFVLSYNNWISFGFLASMPTDEENDEACFIPSIESGLNIDEIPEEDSCFAFTRDFWSEGIFKLLRISHVTFAEHALHPEQSYDVSRSEELIPGANKDEMKLQRSSSLILLPADLSQFRHEG